MAEEEKERGEKQEEEGSGREDWGRVGGGLGRTGVVHWGRIEEGAE